MKVFFTTIFLLFLYPLFSQTCTSSGGDDTPDIDDYPYTIDCGYSTMHGIKKASSDYKLIKTCNNYWAEGNYYKKGNQVYYSPEYAVFNLVKEADANSFRCENGNAKDNKNIYYLGKLIADIDKTSFKAVGKLYCIDNNKVYFKNKYAESGKITEVTEGITSQFKLIGDSTSYYAKDESTVYYYGKTIKGSDAESFEMLEYGYSHDKNNAYYNGEKIIGIKGEGFHVLKDCYLGSDGIALCNGKLKLENSDAASFKAIECGYYKDNNNVYLNGKILEGIDSKTFEILSWGFTKDKNAVYCDMQLIEGANPATFEVLARKHSKDDKNIFYLNKKMDCDYGSFKISTELDYLASDKNQQYSRGVKIVSN